MYCLRLALTSSCPRFSSSDISLSLSCSCWNGCVWKILRNIFLRSSVDASSSFRKSPCAIIAICVNWSRSIPIMSMTARLTSFCFEITRPSGYVICASAFASVKPSPRFFGRLYSGLRFTVYSFPAYANTSSTSVGMSGSAYFERNMSVSLLLPLASP